MKLTHDISNLLPVTQEKNHPGDRFQQYTRLTKEIKQLIHPRINRSKYLLKDTEIPSPKAPRMTGSFPC